MSPIDLDKRKLIAPRIEHTLLAPPIDETHIRHLVREALELQVCGVCVPLAFVPLAKKESMGSNLKVVTVIDFPMGTKSTKDKATEAMTAVALGADELDMVLDYQALIDRNYFKASADIAAVIEQAQGRLVKVIVETSALDHDQLVCAITLVASSQAAFIKTSTGMHKGGAKVENILLMRKLLPPHVKIKASGGIKDFALAKALVDAGADRLGCSKSREILT